MIQTIYTYKDGKYPFNRVRIPGSTFIEVVQHYQSQNAIDQSRNNCMNFKKMQSEYFMRITRILKEEKTLHLLYEYYSEPLEKHVKQITSLNEIHKLINSIHSCVQTLIAAGIKTDLYFENIAVDEHKTLKLFVHPTYQILSNRIQLLEFYETEQKRLQVQIEQMYESINGPICKEKQNQKTNFVINGNCLVFSPQTDKKVSEKGRNPGNVQERKSTKVQDLKNFEKIEKIKEPGEPPLYLQSQPQSPLVNKPSETIKRSRQIMEHIKQQMLKPAKNSNQESTGINEGNSGNFQKEIKKDQKNLPKRQIVHYDSSLEQKNTMIQNTVQSISQQGNPTGAKKMKMKITTCHQIQVQGSQIQKIKEQILKQDQRVLPASITNMLSRSTEHVEIINHEGKVKKEAPNILEHSLSEKVKLAKEKADLIFHHSGNKKQRDD